MIRAELRAAVVVREHNYGEGALPPYPLTAQGSVRYPRGSRPTDIAFGSVPASAGRVGTRLRLLRRLQTRRTTTCASQFSLKAAHDLLADAIDATDRRDHPDLIAYAHLPVGAPIPTERPLHRRRRNLHQRRLVTVIQQTLQVGLDTRMIHHRTRRRIRRHVPDGEPVLNHVIPRPEVPQDQFVAPGDILEQGDAFHLLAGAQIGQGHGDIVGRIDLDETHLRFYFLDFV